MSIKASLIPASYSKIIKTVKKIGVFAVLFLIPVLILVGVMGGFRDGETMIILSLTLGGLAFLPLVLGILYDGICRMEAVFSEDKLCIFDKKGICRQEITYGQITDIRVQEIAGFFYGMNRERVKSKHICFFLNGETEIPDVSYARLFRQKNFIIIGYQEELYRDLKALPLKIGERR